MGKEFYGMSWSIKDILEQSTASFSRVNYPKDGGSKFSEMLVCFEGYMA